MLVVARSQRRQRRSRSDWAKTRRYKLFVLVCIEVSIRAHYKTNTDSIQKVCIQYFQDLLACITLYWFVLLCIGLYLNRLELCIGPY
jgi:hypothetical protein